MDYAKLDEVISLLEEIREGKSSGDIQTRMIAVIKEQQLKREEGFDDSGYTLADLSDRQLSMVRLFIGSF